MDPGNEATCNHKYRDVHDITESPLTSLVGDLLGLPLTILYSYSSAGNRADIVASVPRYNQTAGRYGRVSFMPQNFKGVV